MKNSLEAWILHRYFIWANKMKKSFEMALNKINNKLPDDKRKAEVFINDHFIFMSYWYASLYVVIEGYQDLKLHDSKIDQLLNSPNVNLLRRYRNGVCHYQKAAYFDDRFVSFISSKDSVQWVRQLHDSFGHFFLDEMSKLNSNN